MTPLALALAVLLSPARAQDADGPLEHPEVRFSAPSPDVVDLTIASGGDIVARWRFDSGTDEFDEVLAWWTDCQRGDCPAMAMTHDGEIWWQYDPAAARSTEFTYDAVGRLATSTTPASADDDHDVIYDGDDDLKPPVEPASADHDVIDDESTDLLPPPKTAS